MWSGHCRLPPELTRGEVAGGGCRKGRVDRGGVQSVQLGLESMADVEQCVYSSPHGVDALFVVAQGSGAEPGLVGQLTDAHLLDHPHIVTGVGALAVADVVEAVLFNGSRVCRVAGDGPRQQREGGQTDGTRGDDHALTDFFKRDGRRSAIALSRWRNLGFSRWSQHRLVDDGEGERSHGDTVRRGQS